MTKKYRVTFICEGDDIGKWRDQIGSDEADIYEHHAHDTGEDDAPRAPLTVDELRAAETGTCPRDKADDHKGHYVEYTATETGDAGAWQDASCECGIAWREVSTVTFIVELDDSGDEVGDGVRVQVPA